VEAIVTWWDKNISNPGNYMRGHGDSVGVASRDWVLTQIKDGESLLDVGCGPGVEYENLVRHNRDVIYRGVDFSQCFIDACHDMFPGGDFRFGDARKLEEADKSFDTVLLRHVLEHCPGYADPIAEACRVARKRVLIVMWRIPSVQPDRIQDLGDEGYCSDYNKSEFESYLRSFNGHRTVLHAVFPNQKPHPNCAWVIHKVLDDCVFDLDDFSDKAPNIGRLVDLKNTYPNLKVTLFAIPTKTTAYIWAQDWVEVAVHGYKHENNWECKEWTKDQTIAVLQYAENNGFDKVFRAPGWQLNRQVLEALAERGWMAALQPWDHSELEGLTLPAYYAGGDYRSVHGHMQNIDLLEAQYRNGILQLIDERGLPWDQNTQFHFVSEVAR
jgi:ubiquinone/menaquinone biosynthesis C-methylase UbiE